MEAQGPAKQASPEKKRKRSDSKEAVRKRLQRKREDPDLLLLVEEEIAKRGGGGGCLECRKNLTQVNATLRENLALAKAHMDLLRGKLEMDRMYQKEFGIQHTKIINRQQEVIGLMEASVVDLKATILAQSKFIARKHGREQGVGPKSWLG
jgi:hypothetical protein